MAKTRNTIYHRKPKGLPNLSSTPLTPLDLLLPFQSKWIKDEARFKIGVQARQTGKSFQTACEAARDAFTDPGTSWVCLSSGERQSLEWMAKCKEWAAAFKLSIENYAEDRKIGEALLKVAEITFANGSRVVAIPANPSTARGYSANVILDEFAYHEDPDAIWAAMFPSLTNPLAGTFMERVHALYGGSAHDKIRRELKIRVVSTFNGRENKFFRLWEKRKENGYSGHLTTIYDAIEQGLPLNAEEVRQGLDDYDMWMQEYECQPTDTSNVLLPYALLQQAEDIAASEVVGHDFFDSRRMIFCGIDFGRSNDPTICWTLELVGDILWTREVLVLRTMSTPQQNEILEARIKASTRTCFDYTGPGIGFGDYAVQQFGVGEWKPEEHCFGRLELFTFTPKSKRALFPKLRRKFEAPCKIRIPISRAVREDLHAYQQVVTGGEYNYWAARTKEGHSDRCTALALAVRAAAESGAGVIRDPKVIRFGRGIQSRFKEVFKPMRLAS
jgi:phage FluMu gp28-like protein